MYVLKYNYNKNIFFLLRYASWLTAAKEIPTLPMQFAKFTLGVPTGKRSYSYGT